MRWRRQEKLGSVAELHQLGPPSIAVPWLWVMAPNRPALVLGSAQASDVVLASMLETDGIDLATRSSGGGAVLVRPESTVWVDLWLPAGSASWADDLTQTFLHVGQWWLEALAALGVQGELVRDKPERSDVTSTACFAGHGWGEIIWNGYKVVGLSQRRTRWGARVQAMVELGDASQVTRYLQLDPAARAAANDALRATSSVTLATLPLPITRSALIGALWDRVNEAAV